MPILSHIDSILQKYLLILPNSLELITPPSYLNLCFLLIITSSPQPSKNLQDLLYKQHLKIKHFGYSLHYPYDFFVTYGKFPNFCTQVLYPIRYFQIILKKTPNTFVQILPVLHLLYGEKLIYICIFRDTSEDTQKTMAIVLQLPTTWKSIPTFLFTSITYMPKFLFVLMLQKFRNTFQENRANCCRWPL